MKKTKLKIKRVGKSCGAPLPRRAGLLCFRIIWHIFQKTGLEFEQIALFCDQMSERVIRSWSLFCKKQQEQFAHRRSFLKGEEIDSFNVAFLKSEEQIVHNRSF